MKFVLRRVLFARHRPIVSYFIVLYQHLRIPTAFQFWREIANGARQNFAWLCASLRHGRFVITDSLRRSRTIVLLLF